MKTPKWLPSEVKDWFGRLSNDFPKLPYHRLATSDAMREVWEWYSAGRPHRTVTSYPFHDFSAKGTSVVETEQEKPSPTEFLIAMARSASFPGKPSDMTPKAREAYLGKVKKHALALIDLLQETQYDESIFDEWDFIDGRAKPLDPETLEEKIVDDIRGIMSWCKREDCLLQADYLVDEEGKVYKHSWNYPNSDLVHTLHGLSNWASQDDYFNILHSVKHIRQSGIQGRKTHYLARLDTAFNRISIQVPIAHYATAANVALDLPEHECLDEESARKQIHRIRQRIEQAELKEQEEQERFDKLDF